MAFHRAVNIYSPASVDGEEEIILMGRNGLV